MQLVSYIFSHVMHTLQDDIQVKYIRNKEEQQRMLKACHSDATSGHLGIMKTTSRITERFSWYGMTKDIEEMVSAYAFCYYVQQGVWLINFSYNSVVILKIVVAKLGVFYQKQCI